MIVKWNEARVKVIPNPNGGRSINLLPGNNEVSPKDWKLCRDLVVGDIALGRIVEVEAVLEEVPVVDEKGKATGKTKQKITGATAFKDLAPEKALQVISETYNITTLEEWRKSTGKDELRAAIADQISLVKTKGTTPESK